MNNALIVNIVRFVGIYLFQVLILFYVNIHPSINIFIYPLFILLLPIRIPHSVLILSAFLMGVLVGLTYNAVGEHAAASVFIAFLRPTVLQIMEPRGGFDPNHSPNKHHFGMSWFFQYATILILIHFLAVFSLEVFGINAIVMLKLVLSYIISIIIILLFKLLFNPKT